MRCFERQEGRGSVVIYNPPRWPDSWPWRRRCSLAAAAFVPSLSPSSPREQDYCAGPLAALAESRGAWYCRYEVPARRPACAAARRGRSDLPRGARIRSREIKPEVHGGFALIAQMGKGTCEPARHLRLVRHHARGQKIVRPKGWLDAPAKAVSLSDAPAGLKRTERLEWFESEAMNRVYAMRDELCAEHPGRF